MKKMISFLCVLCVLALVPGCVPGTGGGGSSTQATGTTFINTTIMIVSTTTVKSTTETTAAVPSRTWATITQPTDNNGLPVYIPGSIKLDPNKANEYTSDRPYRKCWYSLLTLSMFNVEETTFYNWKLNVYDKQNPYGEQKEMLLVAAIKHFNVSRKQFDKAVTETIAQNMEYGVDMTEESGEIPNADIIYTFDDAIINNFYRYA